MQLYPNLSFDGRCEDAFRFYEECLGGRITCLLRYDEAPSDLGAPPEWAKKVCHATFALGDFLFSGADALPGGYLTPQGFALQFNLNDPAEAERIFNRLAEDGTVQMPLQETFWAQRFGVLTDQFGIPWAINCGEAV